MSQGRIRALRFDKGFGFISGTNNNDVFFHRTAVVGAAFDDLREGQEVTFQTESDPRDPSRFRAAGVEPATAGSEVD
jgi:CspA family cold shock protein